MKTGVDLRKGVEVHDILRDGEKFSVNTSAGVFRSKLVIISDGINSKMASLLGPENNETP